MEAKVKVGNFLSGLWKEVVYGGHLQCLGMASIVLFSSLLLDLKIGWDLLVVSYLVSYPAYLYNRVKEVEVDKETNFGRTEYIAGKVSSAEGVLLAVVLLFVLLVVLFSNLLAVIFGLLLVTFGLLYTTAFKGLTKKIPLFKNFYVALFFASLVFFALVYQSVDTSRTLIFRSIILSLYIFLHTFFMQVFLDIKDIKSDRRWGLKSLPVLFGRSRTLALLMIVYLFLDVLLPLYLVWSKAVPLFVSSVTVIFLFDTLLILGARSSKYFPYILKGGKFILFPILLMVGKIML